MSRVGLFTLCFAVLAALLSADIACAQRGDREDGEERSDRGDRRGRRFDPAELLKRMDANGNGQLDPDEVSGRARGFVERAAERAGLDPKQPLPIDKLTAALQERSDDDDDDDEKEESSSTETKTDPATTTPGTPATTTPAPETKSEPAQSMIVGFGVESSRTLPPGFGPVAGDDKEKSSTRSGGSRSGSSSSSSTRGGSDSSDKREQAQKVRRYAEGLMKQYDENKNGVLEKDEWKKMRGDPEKADANDDKIITVDELTDRLTSYGSDGGSRDRGDRGSSDRNSSDRGSSGRDDRSRTRSSSDSSASDRKSYRFLSPTERLPKGLPTWFARNDANADGQVTMAEYSSSYNDTTVAEFMRYDLDGDGIITPGECLEAENAKTSSASTTGSTSSGTGSSSSGTSRSYGSSFGRRGGR